MYQSGAVFRGAERCHGVNHQRKLKLQQPLLARQVLLTTLFLVAEEAYSFMSLLLGWYLPNKNCCCTCVVLMWLSLPPGLTRSSQRLFEETSSPLIWVCKREDWCRAFPGAPQLAPPPFSARRLAGQGTRDVWVGGRGNGDGSRSGQGFSAALTAVWRGLHVRKTSER